MQCLQLFQIALFWFCFVSFFPRSKIWEPVEKSVGPETQGYSSLCNKQSCYFLLHFHMSEESTEVLGDA